MHHPPPPDPRELLPPLLACLPTAFISLRPPPALLPLLSPLLRQRVAYLSDSPGASSSGGASRNDGWLPLLCWDAEQAEKLPHLVETMHLEPHPVSGEVELDDVRPAKYRRLDAETLHGRLEVEQFEIVAVYLWCETDEHGGTGAGWKLAELRSMDDLDDGAEWWESQSEANDAMLVQASSTQQANNNYLQPVTSHDGDSEDDSDYWAAYDRTPGRTPAQKRSPGPSNLSSVQAANRERSRSELEYFSRYGAEVQPALDSHDPDEDTQELGESTLNGDSLVQHQQPQRPTSRPSGASLYPPDRPTLEPPGPEVSAPRAVSPTSPQDENSIEKLESRAAEMSEAPLSGAELAIKQHISTGIKSLYRLARSAGMERGDFEGIVQRELECLSIFEHDD